MKLNANTNLSTLAELMGNDYTESEARSFKTYLIDLSITDTDELTNQEWVDHLTAWDSAE